MRYKVDAVAAFHTTEVSTIVLGGDPHSLCPSFFFYLLTDSV